MIINKVVEKTESVIRAHISPNKWNEYMQKIIYKRYARGRFKNEYAYLKNNERFKGIYAGKRCFVLGNGPSLKEKDISFLKDELCITVNQAARADYYKIINPQFHFISDPKFFELDLEKPTDREVFTFFENINQNGNEPKCFVPIQFRSFVADTLLDEKLDMYYFNPSLTMCENLCTDIDFTRFVPGSNTVVHYAIMLAVYMGCTEIVLLGCDCTLVLRDIQDMLDIPLNSYSYRITENEKKRLNELNSQRDIVDILEANAMVFKQYKVLGEYCKKRNIMLLNATPISLLNTVPRINLSDISTYRCL